MQKLEAYVMKAVKWALLFIINAVINNCTLTWGVTEYHTLA